VRDFVAASRLPCTIQDLTIGRASTLIGCSTLVEALPNSPLLNKPGLRAALGDEIFREMWDQLDALPPIRCDECCWLGMARTVESCSLDASSELLLERDEERLADRGLDLGIGASRAAQKPQANYCTICCTIPDTAG